ncbi:MAG: hypothetical protein EA001_15635 [Oscillatoriales cyanobacterium]|nr:MAG: hypothetical protein EA001_15635 [Oscillatoriales cyanobacterium]
MATPTKPGVVSFITDYVVSLEVLIGGKLMLNRETLQEARLPIWQYHLSRQAIIIYPRHDLEIFELFQVLL